MRRLDFSSVEFCGRERELQLLKDAYRKASTTTSSNDVGGPQAVMIVGAAGVGKSALVAQFRKSLPQSAEECIWIQAKVEEGVAPLSEMVLLCNSLIDQLCSRKDFGVICQRFDGALSSELNILEALVPSIGRLSSKADGGETAKTKTNVPSRYSLDQIRYSWRALLRAASEIVPVVVVADDIHFLNVADFEVIGTLVRDHKVHNMMLIGTCRSLEDGSVPPKMVAAFQSSSDRDSNAQYIELSDLRSEQVSNILHKLLAGKNSKDVATLGEIVMRKTLGNPLFVMQFLRILEEKNLLYYSTSTFQWEWNDVAIQSNVDIADNVVDLLMDNMRAMKESEQLVLMTAACFGLTCFDAEMLGRAVLIEDSIQDGKRIKSSEDLLQVLARIADYGLIEDLGGGRFKFSHDRIRESAAALLPLGQTKKEFHLSIGMRLLQFYEDTAASTEHDLVAAQNPRRSELLLRTVIQLNMASEIINNLKQCLRLAELNSAAAKLATDKSAYFLALEFLEAARTFLAKGGSALDPLLDISVEKELAFLYYCCGKIENSLSLVEHILCNPHCTPIDIREIRMIQIKCLVLQTGAEEKMRARDICLSELQALGVLWPKRLVKMRMLKQFVKIRRKLSRMSDEDFFSLPTAANARELIDAVQFLDLMGNIGVLLAEDDYRPLSQLVILDLTLKHGRLVGSKRPLSYILSSWGFFLAKSGKFDEANRFGKLALRETQREEDASNPAHAASIITHYVFISIWKRPWAESLDPLVEAMKTIAEKEVENIYMGSFYFMVYFSCGMSLPPMVKDFARHVEILQEHTQLSTNTSSFVDMTMPMIQFFDNLLGTSTGANPTILQGKFISNQDKFVEHLVASEHHRALQFVFFCKMMLAYYFYDHELAESMTKLLWKPGSEGPSAMEPLRVFFRGMIACQLARKASNNARRRKHMRQVKIYINKYFRSWVEKGAINCHHMLLLLEAEALSCARVSANETRRAYDEAISAAAKIGSLSMRALGNERIGVFFRERGDLLRAKAYLTKARDLYCEWGAMAKVNDMNGRFKECFEEGSEIATIHLGTATSGGGALRARSRLDDLSPLSTSQHKAHVLNALVGQTT